MDDDVVVLSVFGGPVPDHRGRGAPHAATAPYDCTLKES
jgi:hypothetical protein